MNLASLYFPALPPQRDTTFVLFFFFRLRDPSTFPEQLGNPSQWVCNCFSLCLMDLVLRLVRHSKFENS